MLHKEEQVEAMRTENEKLMLWCYSKAEPPGSHTPTD